MMASEHDLENNVGQEIIGDDDKVTFKSLVNIFYQFTKVILYIFHRIEHSHHTHSHSQSLTKLVNV
jgi:hypothetical protein